MLVCVCVCFQLVMSSALEQDGQDVALETVKSVTLTQDKDGSIILHCPTAGVLTLTHTHTHARCCGQPAIGSCLVRPDESCQPVQKKLRLSAEQLKDSEASQFSMVTLPSETLLLLTSVPVLTANHNSPFCSQCRRARTASR